jgi:hypothetical protein
VKVRYCDGGSFTGDGSDAVSEFLSHVATFCFLISSGHKLNVRAMGCNSKNLSLLCFVY